MIREVLATRSIRLFGEGFCSEDCPYFRYRQDDPSFTPRAVCTLEKTILPIERNGVCWNRTQACIEAEGRREE